MALERNLPQRRLTAAEVTVEWFGTTRGVTEQRRAQEVAGTGLGLALCKRLVSLVVGEIGVGTAPGQGSSFRFSLRLPIVKVSAPIKTETGPIDWHRMTAVVDYLDKLVDDGDVQSQTLWETSRPSLAPVLKDRLGTFEEALNAFDFETALLISRAAVAASRPGRLVS